MVGHNLLMINENKVIARAGRNNPALGIMPQRVWRHALLDPRGMRLDLTDGETLALLNLLTDTIENNRYFLSPRIQTLKAIRAKVKPSKTQSPANYARSIEA